MTKKIERIKGKQKEENFKKEGEAFAQYVRSGRFILDLFQANPTSEQWPTIQGANPTRGSMADLSSVQSPALSKQAVFFGVLSRVVFFPAASDAQPLSLVDLPAIQGKPLSDDLAPLQRVDWNALSQQSDVRFPSHWQPAALAASDGFEDFIRSGKAQITSKPSSHNNTNRRVFPFPTRTYPPEVRALIRF